MSRYTGAKCRLCRGEGVKLFLKGERCFTAKCAVTKRESLPGMHTWRRGKPSQYAGQLREKQKMKRYYGMRERPFRQLFHRAERAPGNTGEALVVMLERRLDNVVYLGGFASSRAHARQMISHGHFSISGRRVNIPSILVSQDDVIRPREGEETKKLISASLEVSKSREVPAWLQVSEEPLEITVRTSPGRDDISVETREQLVVELLSK
jgi:small subunit ribosomal protein S4